VLEKIGRRSGVCVVLGDCSDGEFAAALARNSDLLIYFQTTDADDAAAIREAIETAGLLGKRVFVNTAPWDRIALADNLADAVIVTSSARKAKRRGRDEIIRVLRPEGKALLPRSRDIVKPVPGGLDAWSHPYHGPDNNPQSADKIARPPYLTQFLARPLWGCQPQVSVAAGSRIFRAFGHMAFRAYQNEMLNRLMVFSAYNGALLWERRLRPGYMIHRNMVVATRKALYLADDRSCRVLDSETGRLLRELVPAAKTDAGTVWKWMALEQGTLYVLLGGKEVAAGEARGRETAVGGWPWGMWPGYDYRDPKTAWGFGDTFVALDPDSGRILWVHHEDQLLDSRGVCMRGERIYFYSPGHYLGCLDASTGGVRWKTSDPALLKAIGDHTRAQHYRTGFATTLYLKCNDEALFFAGPQRPNLVVASAENGDLLWQKPDGNYQLVLRDDALYAMGVNQSLKLGYADGAELGKLRVRAACTRATGSAESIFVRGGGTMRIDARTLKAHHIAPMRPACHDGVIISEGLLHWGPWICGCNLSLFGNICLAPAGKSLSTEGSAPPLETGTGDWQQVEKHAVDGSDWPAFRADNQRTASTEVSAPKSVERLWEFKPPAAAATTAPVTGHGMVFTGGTDGAVRALDAETGKLRWKAYTAGAIHFPPALWGGRAYVGSNDGHIYAYEATTGRLLWRFRAGPAVRMIPVYGSLTSTWPVAGGILVEDGVVYAAAGITHYDGVHVYALDAITGQTKWHSGPSQQSGLEISLQGCLWVKDGQLVFPAGNSCTQASFDLANGKCSGGGRGRTLFYPRDPAGPIEKTGVHPGRRGERGTFRFSMPEGVLRVSAGRLALFPPGKEAEKRTAPIWKKGPGASVHALARAANALLVAWVTGDAKPTPKICALHPKDGTTMWEHVLPAVPVTWGLAIDRSGRVLCSLVDGRVVCLGGRPAGLPR